MTPKSFYEESRGKKRRAPVVQLTPQNQVKERGKQLRCPTGSADSSPGTIIRLQQHSQPNISSRSSDRFIRYNLDNQRPQEVGTNESPTSPDPKNIRTLVCLSGSDSTTTAGSERIIFPAPSCQKLIQIK